MGSRTAGRAADGRRRVALRAALLRWYDANRRALPWRADADPYRVWVAEVMLQQTRIAVVEPVYRRFLRVFPTMLELAAAGEEEVLAAWSGLGYYRRARLLHRAARLLASEGRRFPRDYDAALTLPGVGSYTAAAVLSIAYGEAHAAVDGNVVRVLSRLRRLGLPDSRGEPHAALAAELLDRRRPGDWNQAIMELGETICTPTRPACPICPLARRCEALHSGTVGDHPPVKKRRATEKVAATMLVLRDGDGRVVLERGAFPYLPAMWLPIFDAANRERARPGDAVEEVRHAITHRAFRIRVVARTVAAVKLSERRKGDGERRIFGPAELARVGRSSLLQKALSVGCRRG